MFAFDKMRDVYCVRCSGWTFEVKVVSDGGVGVGKELGLIASEREQEAGARHQVE